MLTLLVANHCIQVAKRSVQRGLFKPVKSAFVLLRVPSYHKEVHYLLLMSISSAVVYVCPTLEFETLSTQTRNADRSSLLRSLIHAIGLDHHCNQIFSRKARRSEAALAHTQDYLKLLCTLSRRAERKAGWQVTDSSDDEDDTEDALHHSQDLLRQFEAGLVDDCPIFPGVWDLAMFTVGGAVAGAEQLMLGKTSVACWFEGGRHHAAADSAHGFCYCK